MSNADDTVHISEAWNTLLPTHLRLAIFTVFGLWLFILQLNFLDHRLPHLNVLLQYHPEQLPVHKHLHELKINGRMTHQLSVLARRLTKILLSSIFFFYFIDILIWMFPGGDPSDVSETSVFSNVYYSKFFLIVSGLLATAYVIKTIYDNSSANFQTIIRNTFKKAHIEAHTMNRLCYILLSDTLTSYSKPIAQFVQVSFPFCNHVVIGLIGLIPATIRFIQCIREENYWNSFKYSLNYFVFLSSVFGYVNLQFYIMCFQSLYTFWWDCTMDWGLKFLNFNENHKLFQFGYKDQFFLRDNITYPNTYYILVIIVDFILRFVWLKPYLAIIGVSSSHLPLFMQQLLEIIRRWLWIALRLEYDHWSIKSEIPM